MQGLAELLANQGHFSMSERKTNLREVEKEKAFRNALAKCGELGKQLNNNQTKSAFVSYAWGDDFAKKVARLVKHLRMAGLQIPFDKNNHEIPTSEFVQNIKKVDFVLVVCTKLLMTKYDWKPQRETDRAPVLQAELKRLIDDMAMHNEIIFKKIKPLLFEGTVDESVPPLLRNSIRFEEFKRGNYYEGVFDVLQVIYNIPDDNKAFKDIRKTFKRIEAAINYVITDEMVEEYKQRVLKGYEQQAKEIEQGVNDLIAATLSQEPDDQVKKSYLKN